MIVCLVSSLKISDMSLPGMSGGYINAMFFRSLVMKFVGLNSRFE